MCKPCERKGAKDRKGREERITAQAFALFASLCAFAFRLP